MDARRRIAVGGLAAVVAVGLLVGPAAHGADRVIREADELLKLGEAPDGRLYLIEPTAKEMRQTNNKPVDEVLLYYPERVGAPLTVTMPVPADGYYRIMASHVYGAWAQGRYCLVKLAADGVTMPGQHHGWYGSSGPPAHWPKSRTHLVDVNWGIIYLRRPEVELVFKPQDPGLIGIGRLGLIPVPENKLKPQEKDRRVPSKPARTADPADSRKPTCTVVPAGDLTWVVPVPRARVTVDGDLGEWDFANPAVVANAEAVDERNLGWKGPDPQGDGDLSARVVLAWDETHLYLAAKVTDDQQAATTDQAKWGSPWQHDSIVVLVHPPVWLTAGPRSTGPVPDQVTLGLSYYSEPTGPRPLPGGATYKATATNLGYAVEAAIPFEALGFRPAAGDRVPLSLIFSDIDPAKPAAQRFDQYGVLSRQAGFRSWAQLRLLGEKGWGGDLQPGQDAVEPGGWLAFVGTVDVTAGPVRLKGVALVPRGQEEPAAEVACQESLSAGRRYRVQGGLRVPERLESGPYDLRLIVE